ncbi:MAG: hypothetical protein J0I41_01875 [Filimonas sp.]|nr:hypothetical protein [Filimonas sp.]
MLLGTVFTGQVKTQEKQYVETKMFCIGLPVSVVTTMLVTDISTGGRRGIELQRVNISVIATYLRAIVSILFTLSLFAFIANYDEMTWLLIPTIPLLGLTIYSWFYFGKTTKAERFTRAQFGQIFGFYVMPEWLLPSTANSFLDALQKQYQSTYGSYDWQQRFNNNDYAPEDFTYLYCLTYLEHIQLRNREGIQTMKNLSAKMALA